MIKKKNIIWTLVEIFIYPPLTTEEKMQTEEEEMYRGSIRACLRVAKLPKSSEMRNNVGLGPWKARGERDNKRRKR